MADPKPTPKKLLTRCGERVVFAHLRNPYECAPQLGMVGNRIRDAAEASRFTDGRDVQAMALHPAGLAVVPSTGAYAGQRVILPSYCLAFVVVAAEEQ